MNSLRDRLKPTPVLPMLLEFLSSTIELEAKSFKEYILDSRISVKKQQDEFNSKIDNQMNLNPDGAQEIHEFYEDEYYQFNEFYPSTFNNSTLIMIYSFFEYNLRSMCNYLHRIQGHKISLDDLQGNNYIEKSKKYLTLVVGLNLDDLEMTWNKITKIQNIRNCIVHNNSNIRKSKKQDLKNSDLYKVIKSNPNLKLNEEKGTFSISDDQFLIDVIETVEIYLIEIVSKLKIYNDLLRRKAETVS